ncbi:MAG: homogentisate 1,2-dioxygenase [Gammaproteobacteria bacterium]|nr:homogentisate 1,2-dioxygenase [Gammaproteobacteria bacterium]
MKTAYLNGFGNEHESEALPGALPRGRFSPQRPAYGLYAEQFSTTAFTVPRATNRRTWFYRIRPSVLQGGYRPIPHDRLKTAPLAGRNPPPDPLRWDPLEIPDKPADFIDGLVTLAANGDCAGHTGIGVHVYLANRSMADRHFCNADGELLLVPQLGELILHTECGVLEAGPGAIAVLPRGMKFRVELAAKQARGYLCENYGAPFELPERGPVGANGYANDRDFEYPAAAFEDRKGSFELITKFAGNLFATELDHSPLDVVAWTGNSAPYRYDLARFNVIGSVSFDHPDPSINTVLTSPSPAPGTANADFVIFPPRWTVAENTFRPPWYHRNVMSEFMGLVRGVYDGKAEGFLPGGASLHNSMTPHGPDTATFEAASRAQLKPRYLEDTLAFMFESSRVIEPTPFALTTQARQTDYADCWRDLKKRFSGPAK